MTSGDPGNRRHSTPSEHDLDVDPREAGERNDRRPNTPTGDDRPPTGSVIAGVATQGVVTRAALLASGVSRHVIDRRAMQGDLHRRHRGVYLVGHDALAPLAAEHAALLARGERAMISHASAAYVWGMIERPPDCIHVTIVGPRRRPKHGISMHTSGRIDRRDVTRNAGLLITTPARSLVDFAADASERELAAAVAEGRVKELMSATAIADALTRSRGRRGVGRLRALLRAEREPAITRSEAERRLRHVIRAARLPMPSFNAPVAGYTVDAIWSTPRLIVEVDGYRFHGHRAAFERDRAKDAALVAGGHRVIRVTWRQLTNESIAFVAALARALGPGA